MRQLPSLWYSVWMEHEGKLVLKLPGNIRVIAGKC